MMSELSLKNHLQILTITYVDVKVKCDLVNFLKNEQIFGAHSTLDLCIDSTKAPVYLHLFLPHWIHLHFVSSASCLLSLFKSHLRFNSHTNSERQLYV